ncbi:hypothetical protein EAH68_05200 [Corynebacterium hylobatis]|uniref:DUF559 domain-containing protein n=1 Tax=Corynebacterium hylobatis TaxID=1859290 RepID=A0A430HZQ0_9CORY|nr:hypothetical protein [Corynebacterium hylobatis]RSZ64391.1 hypothetical protein EAH68_05200 [Corynebacterium hylobatis]
MTAHYTSAAREPLRLRAGPTVVMITPLTELTTRYAAQPKVLLDDPRLLPTILQKHALASPQYVVPVSELRAEALARHDARYHPRGIAYRVEPVPRALAHHRERPGSLIAEWSALAVLGLDEFSSGADTTILCTSDRKLATDALNATLRRRKKHHRTEIRQVGGIVVAATDHMQTLAACLRSLRNREHAWDTLADLEVEPATVMSVQLIDRFCHRFGYRLEEVRTGLAGLYCSRELRKLLTLSCPGAESRPETILRLLAEEAVSDLAWTNFASQVPVYTDGTVGLPGERRRDRTLLTAFDRAEPRLKIGLMHDGEHHLQRSQRDKDAEITADLMSLGWTVLRTSAGMLRRTAETKRRVREAVLSAAEKLK